MNILELDSFNLADTVKFHDRLNPRLWDRGEHLHPEVHAKLMEIARDFQEFLGVPDLDVKDITVSGSNAAYNYTPSSDIDLHLVVDLPDADHSEVYRELFDAKKFQYNETHNITIGGYDVELYVQNPNQEHHSQGIYSLLRNTWVSVPRRRKADIDDISTRSKYEDLAARIDATIGTGNYDRMSELMTKIRAMRQSGLEQQGEFGSDNLAFKLLRNNGYIKRLVDARNTARDLELSLAELARPPQRVQYGFMSESPDGVNPTTKMFLDEGDIDSVLPKFFNDCITFLNIQNAPKMVLHHNTDWSHRNGSFGQFDPEANVLHLATSGRHVLDILRTMAHELTHCQQNEQHTLPDNAGETGSPYEDEANAMAGRIMRHYADEHPGMFKDMPLEEAAGYIPTRKQARDPRFVMALTRDVRPGATGKEANKLALKTDAQGRPALLTAQRLAESLAAELAMFEDDLFEIKMSPSSLRQEAAQTGALAGMEFEMIVPNVEGSDDGDLEPDYEYDQRCRSIQDAYDFFYDGDFNSRRDVDRMREQMHENYIEWLDEKIATDWDRGGEEYIADWITNNVDESEWNPDDLVGEARNEVLEEYAANVYADPVSDQYQSAYEEYREENQESYDESDWLDAEDLDLMSYVENRFGIGWPHWTTSGGGEAEISDVAQDFENAIGRDTRASGSYHSGSVSRPSVTNQRYIVEPDGSLDGDNPGDQGLEFVSPPLPIDEILSDLNKVRAWAREYGCYTNNSTGLHINISVPDYSRENLDFVKLALLMGDRYVLDAFGRTGNTYAKSAMGIIKDAVRNKPEDAARLLDKMKGNLDQLATKAIHSGITSKYTSINTKDGHIEFRSPGGDWLDQNFDKIENTLLRFTVAMSAALNPEMYREEYLKKLYKLLSENNQDVDTIKYFSDYVAGKIPKAALRSFVKQAQLERKLKKDPTGGKKYWWDVSWGNGRIEVVATSKEEAIDKAFNESYWAPDEPNTPQATQFRASLRAKPLRPYEEPTGQTTQQGNGPSLNGRPSNPEGGWVISPENDRSRVMYRFAAAGFDDANVVRRQWAANNEGVWIVQRDNNQTLGQPDATSPQQSSTGTYELFNRSTGGAVPDTEFSARNQSDVNTRLDDYINHGRHGMDTVDARLVFGVRLVTDSDQPQGSGSGANIGTQTDMENRMGLPSQSATANYAVVDRQTLDPVFRFQADDRRAANRIYGEWLAAAGLPQTTQDYGYQEIRPEIPEVPLDIEQNLPDRTDGRNTDYSFRDLFGTTGQAGSAPAGGEFSGQWRILDGDTGTELFRFRSADPSQAEANRLARLWLQQNAPDSDFREIEVVPVMI